MYKDLWFTHAAYQRMLEIASRAADGLEIGGHLFGYTYQSQGDVVVTHVYPMGPKGKRHPCLTEWDQEEIQRLCVERFGNCRWDIGDFHTHPCRQAEPSTGDISGQLMLREQRGWDEKFSVDVMVIIGVPPGGTPQEVGAWFFTKTERIKLEVRVANPEWNPVDDDGNWIEQTERGT